MPKPLYGENGSGMHINQSLALGSENAFVDTSGELGLSPRLLVHRRHPEPPSGHHRGCEPTVNSYKRLVPGYEAPVYIAWSPGNRSAAIRVPAKRGQSTRIELRTPDPTANPYLALACMLQAGLSASRGPRPPAPVNRNIYHLTDEESASLGITSLPKDLASALTRSRPTRC